VVRFRLTTYTIVVTFKAIRRGAVGLIWTWDEEKARRNVAKHGLTFATAQLVFDDLLVLSQRDSYPDEARWRSIGLIGHLVVLVVHTWPDDEMKPGRIISARQATPRERKEYEDSDL
jgi:uncharacterized DUF497 family protein